MLVQTLRSFRHRLRVKLSALTAASAKPPYPKVSLLHWRSGENVPNFGDDLSAVIVSLLLARIGRTLEDEAIRSSELLAIGSIIHLASEGATLWGSGVNGKIPDHFHTYRKLDVRAVRGPRTREWLSTKRGISAPEIYGDPALLLPRLCGGRFVVEPRVDHLFVPNLNDVLHGVQFDVPPGTEIASPMQSWHKVVDSIVSAKFVSATSLHGIVVAEAFGIPARYVRLTETENLFKYQDYYSGTGRETFEYATSVQQAFEMGGERSIVFDPERLIQAFPVDLWI